MSVIVTVRNLKKD